MLDPRKRRYLNISLAVFTSIALSLVLFFVLYRLQNVGAAVKRVSDILAPFVYGGVVAYLLRPLCNTYESFFTDVLPIRVKKMANALAVGLSLITGILVVYALIIMIAPQLYESVRSLWNSLPAKINQFIAWATEIFGEDEELLQLFNISSQKLYQELELWIQTTVMPKVTNLVSELGSSVLRVLNFFYDLLIGLIVAVYLLGSRKKFARQSVLLVRSALKPQWADMFLEEVKFIDRMFGGFIDGKIVDSAIIGVLCYIGCLIFRFPNALLIAAFVGITNVIPFFGPFIGAIPSIFLILIEDPMKAVWFGLFILALQQLDGNIIGPAILGDRTGLSSFWVLFTIILFGGLFGIVGMIIAVPLFAVIYDTIKKLVRRGLFRKDQIELWEQYKIDYPDEEPKKK
ncbi:MAG: AI-2E family transporter [Oscillospiraceae bacterium]|nr:AI-2E family transporter [Oscillospiraceae bacterium]